MASNEQLRERILDAAVSVLTEIGRPTSKVLSAVAERAGVSRPTIYRQVGPQDALFEALLRRELVRRLTTEVVPALNDLQDPREDLKQTLEVMIRMVSDHPVVQYVVRESPATVVRLLDRLAPMLIEDGVPVLTPVFAKAAAEGRFPAVDVPSLIIWACRISSSRITLPTQTPVREEIDQLFVIIDAIASIKP